MSYCTKIEFFKTIRLCELNDLVNELRKNNINKIIFKDVDVEIDISNKTEVIHNILNIIDPKEKMNKEYFYSSYRYDLAVEKEF